MPSPVDAPKSSQDDSSSSSGGGSSNLLSQSPNVKSANPPVAVASGATGVGPAAARTSHGTTTMNVCNSSHFQQNLTRPSMNSNVAEFNSTAKPRRGNHLDEDMDYIDDANPNNGSATKKQRGGLRFYDANRNYASKTNAANNNTNTAVAAPSSSGLSKDLLASSSSNNNNNNENSNGSSKHNKKQQSSTDKPQHRKMSKLERKFESYRRSTSPNKQQPHGSSLKQHAGSSTKQERSSSPSPSGSSSSTSSKDDNNELLDPNANAATNFRESYETKNGHSQKNLRNINDIARNKEDAMHVGQVLEVEEVDDGGEVSKVMSQLTCPYENTQAYCGPRDEDSDEDGGDDSDGDGTGGERDEDLEGDELLNGGGGMGSTNLGPMFDVEYDDVDDELAGGGGDNKMAAHEQGTTGLGQDMLDEDNDDASKDELPPPQKSNGVVSGLMKEYEKALHGGNGDEQGGGGVQGGAKKRPVGKQPSKPKALGATKKQPASAAADPTKKKVRKGRAGAVARALAAEHEQPEPTGTTNDEGDGAKKQQGKKRKQYNPTAQALAEYDETGEVDSYCANSRAVEERKGRLLALAACHDNQDRARGDGNDDNEYGHTSFNCDDDEIMPETEKQSEPLLGGTEKQSEPLLDNTEKQSEPLLGTAAASSSDAATTALAPAERKQSINKLVLGIREELDMMKNALKCPFCLATLNQAAMLPCAHAVCRGCVKNYYNPRPTFTTTGPDGKRQKVSPHKPKNECPVCRHPNTGKRAPEPAPHLDELVIAYKRLEKDFGHAPVKHTKGIVMTQIDPTENDSFYDDDSESDEEDDRKMPAKKRESHVNEYAEHLQVAKTNHSVYVDEAERQQEVKCYQHLAKEQEAVVRADKDALDKEVKRFGGAKEMLAAVTAQFAAEAAASSTANDAMFDRKVAATSSSRSAAMAKQSETANLQSNEEPEEEETEKAKDQSKDESTIGEEEFCTAPDESQSVEYDTAREESQTTSSQHAATALNSTAITSPMVLHDGHTVKKADRPEMKKQSSTSNSIRGSNVFDLERSPESTARLAASARASTATAATTSSSPIVLHDGNTAKKKPHEPKPNRGLSLLESTLDTDPTPRRSGAPLPAFKSAEKTDASDEELDNATDHVGGGNNMPAPKVGATAAASAAASPEPETKETEHLTQIEKGSIVFVQARTWPGINKPGGVARVTRVHNDGGNSTKYDVKYILGGSEKKVDESFVSLNEANELSTIEECLDESRMTRGSMSAEKKRPARRRAAVKTEPTSSAAAPASVPIYNDEDLKHIPDDVLKWAGIVPKKEKKAKAKSAPGSPSKKGSARGKKRVLSESNAKPKAKPSKKKKASTSPQEDEASPEQDDQQSNTVEGLSEVLSSLSNEEVVSLADARYSSLLSLDKKQSKSDAPLTLHVVTSSLTDKDSKKLDSLCKMLKGKSVVLKLMKDFNTDKTQLCITATASPPPKRTKQSGDIIDVTSKSRTLKVMRSALAGLPILTPQWIDACLTEGHLVAPSGVMCVRTLPRKGGEDEEDDHFGVAKYAAAFEKTTLSSSNHLLSGVSVMLCGSSAGSGMIKDLKVLLQQAGASIISSVSMATRHLTDLSKGGEAGPLVFLCDDSTTNKSCGVSDALFKQAKKLAEKDIAEDESETVLCVHFNWLFDSISCATAMDAGDYEPLAPRTKELWSLLTTPESQSKSDRRKESQIY